MNRREFLRSSTLPAVGAVVAGSAASAPAAASPALAALMTEAAAANDRLSMSIASKEAARAAYLTLVGEPDDLARYRYGRDRNFGLQGKQDRAADAERVLLYDLNADGLTSLRLILEPQAIIDMLNTIPRKSRFARYLRLRLAAAAFYENKKVEAVAVSGIDQALDQMWSAKLCVVRTARAVLEAPAETIVDLGLKASALEWMRRADECGGNVFTFTPVLLADVKRLCEVAT